MGTTTTITSEALTQPLRPVPPFDLTTAPSTNDVLKWNGSAYAPGVGGSGGTNAFGIYVVGAPTGNSATDTAAIAAAVTLAATAGSGRVTLSAGTYRVQGDGTAAHGCVQLTDKIELLGLGMGVTILKVKDAQATDLTGIVRTPSGVQNAMVRIANLTIDGNKANKSGTPDIIGFYCGVTPQSTSTDTDIVCEHVEIMNCTGYGFDPHERTTRLRLVGCIAHHNDVDGFTLDGCYDTVVQGCVSYSNGRHGFNLVTGSNGIRITGCESYSNASNGLVAQQGAKNAAITGSLFYGNTSAGVVLNGVAQSAPQLDTLPGGAHTVTGCQLRANGTHGLQLVGCSGNSITGNHFRDNSATTNNTSDHLKLDESGTTYSQSNVISGNSFAQTSGVTNTAKYAIEETSSSDGPNVCVANVIPSTAYATAALQLRNGTSALAAAHNGVSGDGHPSTTPYADDAPARHGWLEWVFPVSAINTVSNVLTSGTLYLVKITAQTAGPVTNIVLNLGTVGATLTSGQNLVALFDSAGNRLAVSADQTTAWGSGTGIKSAAISSTALTAGADYWVAILSVGTTPAAFSRGPGSVAPANGGLATTVLKYAINGTGLTAIPSTITPSSNTGSNAATIWAALS